MPTVDPDTATLRGWLSVAAAERLLGRTVASLTALASQRDFVPLATTVRMSVDGRPRNVDIESANVVARIAGSDPALATEQVIFSAHWDHLGRDSTASGDQIYNGAIDNAGGVAQLLAIAEAFTRLRPSPRRSILFLFTTAEEAGLIGARHYATHPLYPLARKVAAINLDWFFSWGRTRDMIVIGHGSTTLEDVLAGVLRGQSRIVTPDPSARRAVLPAKRPLSVCAAGNPGAVCRDGQRLPRSSPGLGQGPGLDVPRRAPSPHQR
jgi:Zn-dependent M28 family amino/carboxypeptidase